MWPDEISPADEEMPASEFCDNMEMEEGSGTSDDMMPDPERRHVIRGACWWWWLSDLHQEPRWEDHDGVGPCLQHHPGSQAVNPW